MKIIYVCAVMTRIRGRSKVWDCRENASLTTRREMKRNAGFSTRGVFITRPKLSLNTLESSFEYDTMVNETTSPEPPILKLRAKFFRHLVKIT